MKLIIRGMEEELLPEGLKEEALANSNSNNNKIKILATATTYGEIIMKITIIIII